MQWYMYTNRFDFWCKYIPRLPQLIGQLHQLASSRPPSHRQGEREEAKCLLGLQTASKQSIRKINEFYLGNLPQLTTLNDLYRRLRPTSRLLLQPLSILAIWWLFLSSHWITRKASRIQRSKCIELNCSHYYLLAAELSLSLEEESCFPRVLCCDFPGMMSVVTAPGLHLVPATNAS